MLKPLHLICACVVPLLFSCKKTYGIEVSVGTETTISISAGQPDSVFKEQNRLIEEMQKRHQISDVREYNGVWTIDFNLGKNVRLSESVFPAIQADESNRWVISGFPTGIEVRKDEKGNLILPVLSYGTDGGWYLDERPTDFPIEEYQGFLLQEGNDTLNLKGLLTFEDKIYFYMSDDTIRKYSIIKEGFYLVPDYWMEFLVEKEREAEMAIREMDGNGVAFVFFTDPHWGYNFKRSPALIRHITEFSSFSNVFCGGDIITNFFNNTVTPMQVGLDFQASFSFLGPHFYCVYGNHDNNSSGQPSATERHLDEEMVISYLQSQMTELDKKEGYNFYFDDPTTKTRFVGLDTGRYNNATFRTTSVETARFLIDALSGTPEGWHILVVSHIWAEYKKINDVETSTFTAYFNTYLQIIHDYNDRKAGIFTYKKETVAYDFSSGLAKAECCFGGHTHLNSILYSKDVLPVIITGKDSMKRSFHKGVEETINEQCVVLYVIDYNTRKIKLFHVGYGDDQAIDLPPITE